MFGIRTTRLFPARSQRPWLRGRRRVSFSDLSRAAEAGDADAVEGLLSLVLSGEAGESEFSERALASLEDLLGEEEGEAHLLAKLEVEAQCFELVEKEAGLTQRMPALLLRAAGRHAEDRGYHVTGERITQALAARRAP